MKFLSTGVACLAAGTAAHAASSCAPTSNDMQALKFGCEIQQLLWEYYNSVSVNETFFSSLPNTTLDSTNLTANFMGLQQQSKLAEQALQQLAAKGSMSMSMMPSCKYNPPMPMDAKHFLKDSFHLEASLCGAFIGLADYTTCPEVSFLFARVAAGHGAHAIYVASQMKEQIFMANSSALLPAFTPEHVASKGMKMGQLGGYIGGQCLTPPQAPCGGKVEIGKLGSNLTSTTSGSMPTPMATNAGVGTKAGLTGAAGAVVAAAAFI